jgi:hypothetical protein
MEIKEKLYKEKVSENKTTEIHYKMHEIKPIYCFSALLYSILPLFYLPQQGGMAMAFIEES